MNPIWQQLATRVQPRLSVSAPDDPYEREADQVADRVMRMSEPAVQRTCADCAAGGAACPMCEAERTEERPLVQRKCAECEEEESGKRIQRREAPLWQFSAPLSGSELAQPEAGRPLDAQPKQFFESLFDRNFSAVRVHTGTGANDAARSINALAYTAGPNIVFRNGAYSPNSSAGALLLAHELSHVVQQGRAPALEDRPDTTIRPSGPAIQRRVYDPAVSAPVNDLNNRELADAIEKTQMFLLIRVISPDAEKQARANLDLLLAERDTRKMPSPLAEGKREAWQEGEGVSTLGIVQVDAGTWFYTNMKGVPRRRLLLNELVAVERKIAGNWYLIVTKNGEPGYVDAADINTSMPDPEAKLYRIETNDTAIGIVKKFYSGFKYSEDQRFYVNVLVLVNHQAKRPGIKNKTLEEGGEGKADVDWEASQVFSGMQIWIPGQSFAKSLKGKVPTGSISYDTFTKFVDFLSDVGEFLLGALAFVAGLLHGALESLWDLVVGLVDLVKMAYSLIKSIVLGDIINDVSGIWDTLKKIKLSDVFDAVEDWLDKKWNAPGTWDRWHFRGWLIGYIIMEIVLLVASDGLLAAVKWVGKAAKIEKLVAKIPFLAKVVERAKEMKKAGQLVDVVKGTKIAEGLIKARKWAQEVLAIPLEILELLTEETIGRLKKLPAWAMERFRDLSAAAMKIVLGCTSPCKVDVAKIMEHLAGLAEKGYVGAKKLLDKADVLTALGKLQKKLNTGKIAEYLEKYPALMKVIRKAELTDADLLELGEFLTGADATNPETAYRTFTRYLTHVVPAKTGNDIAKFNEIMEDLMKVEEKLSDAEKVAQIRQGAALKGSMFEAFARMHLPEFAGKVFRRVRFKAGGVLELATETRTSDFFIEATGELWDFKHSMKVDMEQAADYVKILNHAESGLPKVTSINYLFPSEDLAKANSKLKDLGAIVHYVSPAGKLVVL